MTTWELFPLNDEFVITCEGREVCFVEDAEQARLIAAAPDLLKACKEFMKYRQEMIDAGANEAPLSHELILRFAHIQGMVSERIELAIKKAQGE